MDNDDGMELDDDEINELMDGDPDHMTPEDVFKMVMINKLKGTRVKVELQDQDGDKVELSEVIKDLLKYMEEKVQDQEGNQFTDQIMPLISQSVVSCLGRMVGIQATAFYLTDDMSRTAILWSMCISFLLLKYVQKHNLVINTYEEELAEHELEDLERKAEANKVAVVGAMLGQNPKDILSQLFNEGKINKEDIKDWLGEDETDDEE